MTAKSTHNLFKKSTLWLSVLLFFIASCQTKKTIEALFDITLSKNIAASKTTAAFNCSVYEATATKKEIVNKDVLFTTYTSKAIKYATRKIDLHAAKVAKTHYPLKIPLYLLFKNLKIAFLVRA